MNCKYTDDKISIKESCLKEMPKVPTNKESKSFRVINIYYSDYECNFIALKIKPVDFVSGCFPLENSYIQVFCQEGKLITYFYKDQKCSEVKSYRKEYPVCHKSIFRK